MVDNIITSIKFKFDAHVFLIIIFINFSSKNISLKKCLTMKSHYMGQYAFLIVKMRIRFKWEMSV